MNLAEALTKSPPRETSGARTSSRYDFQKNWALCKLLELYQGNADFLMLLDYHEDIVVLNGESSPTEASFYQIKTKSSGNWTIASLTKRPKGKDGSELLSIFDKLYSAHLRCGESARRLCFVSNKPINLRLMGKLNKEEVDSCSFREMNVVEKERIHKLIEGDSVLVSDYDGLCKLHTDRAYLSLDDHESHTKGRIVAFFEALYPEKNVQTTAVYRALFDEIKRKTNDDRVYSEFNELARAKGVGLTDFRRVIAIVGNRDSVEALWGTAKAYLIREAVPPVIFKSLQDEFFRYAISHMNPIDEDVQSLSSCIRELLSKNRSKWAELRLVDISENICKQVKAVNINGYYSDIFIKAAAIYEVLDETVQEADSESSEETE